jgi:UDP-glucose 4-epimerase
VREVLHAVEQACGDSLPKVEAPRRPGDPPILVAVADKIKDMIGWTPKFDDLHTIVRTSLEWERKIAAEDPDAYWPT